MVTSVQKDVFAWKIDKSGPQIGDLPAVKLRLANCHDKEIVALVAEELEYHFVQKTWFPSFLSRSCQAELPMQEISKLRGLLMPSSFTLYIALFF